MAGHSKWSNIKRRKGAQDVKRGKANTRLIREVMVAARAGGPDKSMNAMLRLAVERANKANVTKESIERAILKATGQLQGEELFEISYEGYAPHGIAVWVHCMTDNKNRTVAEVRHAFSKQGATLGTDGSVSYLFDRVARIVCEVDDVDAVMEAVLDFDVQDVEAEDGMTMITANPSDLNPICQYLSEHTDWPIIESEVTYTANAQTELEGDAVEKVERFIDALESLDDVQSVYSNMIVK